jgi:predicted phage terminase large subunit-like protein
MSDVTGSEARNVYLANLAAEELRRRKMRESLVGFAESIVIPGAPVSDDADDAFTLYDGRVTTLRELDPDGVAVDEWHRERVRREQGGRLTKDQYDHLFEPVGSSLALHHRVLLEKVQRCMETRYGRLMIFMPPGSAKSTYTTVVSAAWAMGRWPGIKLILASYATPIAKKHGSRGRLVVEQPAYFGAFQTKLSKDSQAKEMWGLENGSEYMSGGMLSGLTGNRAGGVILDDPVKGRQAADSPVEQARTKEAYEDDLFTRMIPGAWLILINTRWNMNDLSGGILPADYAGQSGPVMCRDGQVWEILNIPGKAEHADDPLGREVGDYLWPEWFDQKFWEQYEPRPDAENSPSERRWASLIQQRPRPDSGNMFEEDWFQRYKPGEQPKALNLYSYSDYATKEDEGDFTEHGIWGVDKDGYWWAVDWFFGQVETDVGIDELLRLTGRHGVTYGFGESGVIRHAIEPAFRRRKRDLGLRLHIEYLKNAGSKSRRILSFQSLAHSGKVFIPETPWGDRLIQKLCEFPFGKNDDAADVCSLVGRSGDFVRWSAAKVARAPRVEPRFGSWDWLTTVEKKPNGEKRYY